MKAYVSCSVFLLMTYTITLSLLHVVVYECVYLPLVSRFLYEQYLLVSIVCIFSCMQHHASSSTHPLKKENNSLFIQLHRGCIQVECMCANTDLNRNEHLSLFYTHDNLCVCKTYPHMFLWNALSNFLSKSRIQMVN